jgi:proline dehydrogenase
LRTDMPFLRHALLAASTNAWLRDHATKTAFVRRSVARFMPGEHAADALRAAQDLEPQGITTILTRLGENLTTAAEFEDVTAHYLDVLDRIAASGLDAHISVKPTQLGLDLDPALCEKNLERLIARAGERRNIGRLRCSSGCGSARPWSASHCRRTSIGRRTMSSR